jgi:hypothetical protein
VRALRGSAPGLTRAVMTTLLDPQRRRAVAEALARFEQQRAPALFSGAVPRHPLAPAAVRVERTRSRGRRGREAEQVAVTMWFGEGPALPAVGGRFGSGAARVGVGVAGAAALAAASTLVARLAERPAAPLLPATAQPKRLGTAGVAGGPPVDAAPEAPSG